MKLGDNILARIEIFVRTHVTKEFIKESGWTGSLEFYAPQYILEQLKPIYQSWLYFDNDKLSVTATPNIEIPKGSAMYGMTAVQYHTNPNLNPDYIHAHLYKSTEQVASMMVPVVYTNLEALEKNDTTYWNF